MVKNLKKLRNARKISQQYLAAQIGISQQSVNKYENHDIEPDIDTLIAMANYFQVSIDYLVGRYDEKDKSAIEEMHLQEYRSLSEQQRDCVDNMIKLLNDKK